MIARQKVLLGEMGADSLSSVELRHSLVRLEAAYEVSKAALDVLHVSGGEDVEHMRRKAPELDEKGSPGPVRGDGQQPSWFKYGSRPG